MNLTSAMEPVHAFYELQPCDLEWRTHGPVVGPPQDDGLICRGHAPSELVHGFRLHNGRITWYAISSSRTDVLRAARRLD